MTTLSHHRRRICLLTLSLLLALTLAGCGGDDDSGAAAEPASLSLALEWFPNPDHIPLFYAQEKGFFDEQNLTVEMKTPSDPTAGLKLVATNRFDLAVFYEADMFFAAEQGLPVIAVAAMIPQPLNSLLALDTSKVQKPCDVKGATVGVTGLPFNDAVLDSIRDQCGLEANEVKKVNVGFNLVPALLTKKVDAVIGAYWNIEGFYVSVETGKEPVIIRMSELGVPHYDELLIVANREKLASDEAYADAVRRFLAAIVAASEAAQDDEAGVIAIMKKSTEYKPAEIEAMVPPTLSMFISPKGLKGGCMSIDGWTEFGQWMLGKELLKAEIDPNTIATNEYLPHSCD